MSRTAKRPVHAPTEMDIEVIWKYLEGVQSQFSKWLSWWHGQMSKVRDSQRKIPARVRRPAGVFCGSCDTSCVAPAGYSLSFWGLVHLRLGPSSTVSPGFASVITSISSAVSYRNSSLPLKCSGLRLSSSSNYRVIVWSCSRLNSSSCPSYSSTLL